MGSENFKRSCEWAYERFVEFGLENVHLEECGTTSVELHNGKTPGSSERLGRSTTGGSTDSEPGMIYNVVADITGTHRPDEYVIIGAHLDSAPQGAGATDNGTGVAAVMEAARILMESEARPRRTIRFVLFGGEEAGLVGSNAYVEAHEDLLPKISAMFNMDHGSNYISSIDATEPLLVDMKQVFAPAISLEPDMPFEVKPVDYLPKVDPTCCPTALLEGEALPETKERMIATGACGVRKGCGVQNPGPEAPGVYREVIKRNGDSRVVRVVMPGAPDGGKDINLENLDLEALGISLEELKAGGNSAVKVVALGSSDHAPFLAAGIPAFWWGQEVSASVPYPAHTENDTYDKVNSTYLEHSATVIALGALGTATLDHMLSRERLTSPDDPHVDAEEPTALGLRQASEPIYGPF